MRWQSKIGSIVLLLALMLSLFPASAAFATSDADAETYTFTEDLGNDYLIESTVFVYPTQVRGASSTRVTVNSVIKHADKEIANISFVAAFSYNGSTSSVTSTSYTKDTSIGWVYTHHNISTTGGRARLTADLVSLLGTVPISITIYCSPSGEISTY